MISYELGVHQYSRGLISGVTTLELDNGITKVFGLFNIGPKIHIYQHRMEFRLSGMMNR